MNQKLETEATENKESETLIAETEGCSSWTEVVSELLLSAKVTSRFQANASGKCIH